MFAALSVCITLLFVSVRPQTQNYPAITGLNTTQIIEYEGYPFETHEVITTDGYILQLHRIPYGLDSTSSSEKPVIYIMPGIAVTSAIFLLNGRKQSLPFILADRGYDVWIGNPRGSTYARKHVTLDPDIDAPRFWNFSLHELGIYDAANSIDYVLSKTGQKDLIYIGHSEGTTDFFIMNSELPQYNDKIRLGVIMAPVVFMEHLSNPIARILANFADNIQDIYSALGIFELLPHTESLSALAEVLCYEESPLTDVCSDIVFLAYGFDDRQFNRTKFPALVSGSPAGCSVKQLVHYGQLLTSGKFRQYDYGILGNLNKYHEFTPPSYNLKKVTAPVALYYASNDWLSSATDVSKLQEILPNVVKSHLISYEQWNHLDYVLATEVNKYLYDDVVSLIQQYSTSKKEYSL